MNHMALSNFLVHRTMQKKILSDVMKNEAHGSMVVANNCGGEVKKGNSNIPTPKRRVHHSYKTKKDCEQSNRCEKQGRLWWDDFLHRLLEFWVKS